MILVVGFDDKFTILQVPDRLDYNVLNLYFDFKDWIEDNQKYVKNAHKNSELLLEAEIIEVDDNDFIYWIKSCILEKDEHIRVFEQKVDISYVNKKYPKRKRHTLYFYNTYDGYLEY